MFKTKEARIFLIMTFVNGISSSFFYPLSSLFIIEELGASPMMLSVFMVLSIISSVIVSQTIAAKSDNGWNRKTILLGSLTCYFITVVSFSVIRDYYLAVASSMVFGALSGAAMGQLFALGREYADKHIDDSTTFLSVMRAGIAIAWVIGPPIAFIVKGSFGFSVSFLTAGGATLLSVLLGYLYLPNSVIKAKDKQEKTKQAPISGVVVLFGAALVFMLSANNLYVITMPLYLSQELKVAASWVGYMFGMAALCEIPFMLKAGKLAARFGTMRLLSASLVCGCLFFIAMLNVTEFWQLLTIQVFNGVFVGITATIGMVALQDMMKDRLGTASTLFTSLLNVSVLISSTTVGIVGEMYSYHSAFYVSLMLAVTSLLMMAYFVSRESQARKAQLQPQIG